MKKFFTIAIALLMVFALAVPAHAVVYTVSDTIREKNDQGDDFKRVYGTIAFDSDYPCNNTTGRCGEVLTPSQIGMNTITQLFIDGDVDTGAIGYFVFKYHAAGLSGSGSTTSVIRAYIPSMGEGDTATTIQAPMASAPTYDLSALIAVPFQAIGT